MLNIAVIFGGVSCEHDISVISGIQVINNFPKEHNLIPIYIHNDGIWYTGEALKNINSYKDFDNIKKRVKTVVLLSGGSALYSLKKNKLKYICQLDGAVLALHGLNGEDGSVQGLMQLCNIPQTSCGIAGSGIGMDKILSKIFFAGLGLDILPYTYITRKQYMFAPLDTLLKIEKELEYPVIVKPCMLGSSIGISKCASRGELAEAIEVAMRFDSRIIIEKAADDFIEINCSALKINGEIKTSECEKPVNWRDFLKFEDKYCGGSKGMADAKRIFPANIEKNVSDKIKEITALIYEKLDLKGVIRADYIVADKIYINEINTIPGSLCYYLWDYQGINFAKLIDIIINEASAKFREFNKCTFSFKSNVLNYYGYKNLKNNSKIYN